MCVRLWVGKQRVGFGGASQLRPTASCHCAGRCHPRKGDHRAPVRAQQRPGGLRGAKACPPLLCGGFGRRGFPFLLSLGVLPAPFRAVCVCDSSSLALVISARRAHAHAGPLAQQREVEQALGREDQLARGVRMLPPPDSVAAAAALRRQDPLRNSLPHQLPLSAPRRWYHEPGARTVAWKRLWARFDRDPDLFLIHLCSLPFAMLARAIRGRGEQSASPPGLAAASLA